MDIVNITHRLASRVINIFEVFADIGGVYELRCHYTVILVEDKCRRTGVPHGS